MERPGCVIGQDNVVVFIHYGGALVCVHESRIKRDFVKSVDLSKNVVKKSQPLSLVDPINERSSGHVCHDDDDEIRDHSHDFVGQSSEDTDTQEKGLDHESDSDYDPTEDPQEQVSDNSVQNDNNLDYRAHSVQEIIKDINSSKQAGGNSTGGNSTLKLKENDIIKL